MVLANSGIHQHWVTLLPGGAEAAGSGLEIGIAGGKPLAGNVPHGAAVRATGASMCFAG